MTDNWRAHALCAQTGGDWWYADLTERHSNEIKTAITICNMCDVQTQCLEYALKHDERYGVWGGLTSNQRIQLRRKKNLPPVPHLQPCGTTAAYRRHRRANETPCQPCAEANRQAKRRRRRENP